MTVKAKFGGLIACLGTSLFMAAIPSSVNAAEVDIVDLLAESTAGSIVRVDVQGTDTLVFGGKSPELVLHGKRIFISAPKLRVVKSFRIAQFDESDDETSPPPLAAIGEPGSGGDCCDDYNGHPGAPGQTGKPGNPGTPGKNAPLMVLDVRSIELEPGSQLTIVNQGSRGGPGGTGGTGGTGGKGGGGKQGKSVYPNCEHGGGDGGQGGRAGDGGTGGNGGAGGAGGTVKVSPAVEALAVAGQVVVSVTGGAGGPEGKGGSPGAVGKGGEMGSGYGACEGGHGGPDGDAGQKGADGTPGTAGADGKLVTLQ